MLLTIMGVSSVHGCIICLYHQPLSFLLLLLLLLLRLLPFFFFFCISVNVKWGKEQYEVDLAPEDGLDAFRAAIFSLTSVAPDRQKLMVKGKQIKVWSKKKKKEENEDGERRRKQP